MHEIGKRVGQSATNVDTVEYARRCNSEKLKMIRCQPHHSSRPSSRAQGAKLLVSGALLSEGSNSAPLCSIPRISTRPSDLRLKTRMPRQASERELSALPQAAHSTSWHA